MDHVYSCAEPKKRKVDTSGTNCFALNCSTYRNSQTKAEGITFHKFPDKTKDKDRYETWVRNCRRHSEPTPGSRICSQHFEPVMINRTLNRALLREWAVPTIFTLPGHLQPQKTKERLTKTGTKALEPLEMPAPESPTKVPLAQDHDYSDDDVRKRNLELEAENDRLRKELRNANVREERAKKEKQNILQQLKDANLLKEELELKLSSYVQSHK